MNTLIFHSAPIAADIHALASNGGKISLHIGTAGGDSISLIFSPDDVGAVADTLEYAVFKLRALAWEREYRASEVTA